VRHYPSFIAGLRYRSPDGLNRARYCATHVKAGDFLEMVRERDNAYSTRAVALHSGGHHLGYIPERHRWVGRALDDGETMACMVTEVRTHGWLFVRAHRVSLMIGVADRATRRATQKA
jgi:hypothetical protein